MINQKCHETTASHAVALALRTGGRGDRRVPASHVASRRQARLQERAGHRDARRAVAFGQRRRDTVSRLPGQAPRAHDRTVGGFRCGACRSLPRLAFTSAPAPLAPAAIARAWGVRRFSGLGRRVRGAAKICRSLMLIVEHSRVGASLVRGFSLRRVGA